MKNAFGRLSFFLSKQLPWTFLQVLTFLHWPFNDYDEVIYIVAPEITFNVTGQVAVISTLDVTGQVAVISTLDVTGQVAVTSVLDVTGQVSVIQSLDVTGQISAISQFDVGGSVSAVTTFDVTGQIRGTLMLGVTGLIVEDYIFLYQRTGGVDNETVVLTLRKSTAGTPLSRSVQIIPTGSAIFLEISYDGTNYGPEIEVPANQPLRIPAAARKIRVRTPQTNVAEFLPTGYMRRR